MAGASELYWNVVSDIIVLLKKILLLPYLPSRHLQLLEKWLTDEKLMAGWDIPPFWPDKVKGWADEPNKVILMIEVAETGEVIGFVNFYEWDKKKGVASRGTLIDPKFQNRGYGKESILASNKYAFERMGLKRIELYVSGDNKVSRHIAEKLGYKFDRFDVKKNRYYYFMGK